MEPVMNLQTLSSYVPKVQRRMPDSVARLRAWTEGQDFLYARHWLESRRRNELETLLARCRTPRDHFEFAARLCPSHQIAFEILGFLHLARAHAPATVVEIGTAEGGTNFLLSATLPDVSLKIGIDLHVRNTRLLRAFGRPDCRQEFVNGSSRDMATVEKVRRLLQSRPVDVLFIDGDHRYEGARADFDLYAPLVRPGGLIALHDIVPDYQTRYGRNTGRWAGDVPRLWQEVRARYAQTWEFVENPDQDGLGIGVVRVS
jgi:cephalosporin hydroxylase